MNRAYLANRVYMVKVGQQVMFVASLRKACRLAEKHSGMLYEKVAGKWQRIG